MNATLVLLMAFAEQTVGGDESRRIDGAIARSNFQQALFKESVSSRGDRALPQGVRVSGNERVCAACAYVTWRTRSIARGDVAAVRAIATDEYARVSVQAKMLRTE